VTAGQKHSSEGHAGWLEHTLGGISASIERAVFTEEHARSQGWLQGLDARAKLAMFIVVVLAVGFTNSVGILVAIYAFLLVAAGASRLPFDFFVRRVWLGIPLFAAIVVIPALFIVPGPRIYIATIGSLDIALSQPGVAGAILFVTRVGVSVSLAVLLVMTTPWAELLRSLRAIHVPQVFVLILSMTYRYIFLFLHTTNGLFLARKSRIVARTSGSEQRRWIAGSMGALTGRAFKMSGDVYSAMMARGFTGEMRVYNDRRLAVTDVLAMLAAATIAAVALVAQGLVA
jgi:cobalt/nickel transport system permease protein